MPRLSGEARVGWRLAATTLLLLVVGVGGVGVGSVGVVEDDQGTWNRSNHEDCPLKG